MVYDAATVVDNSSLQYDVDFQDDPLGNTEEIIKYLSIKEAIFYHGAWIAFKKRIWSNFIYKLAFQEHITANRH